MKKEEAIKRVRELKQFYKHLFSYIAINIFLIAINLLTSPGKLWFYWVTIFWGISIAFHAYRVFVKEKFLGREWEDQKIAELTKDNKTEQ